MPDLFDKVSEDRQMPSAPLAERLRPRELHEVVGQEDLLGSGKPLNILIEADHVPSMILWGPPGTGKTTIARIIASHTKSKFHGLSAVLSGVKDLRAAVEQAKNDQKYYQQRSILFIDEIHRFNKAQQDALLPHVESGVVTLIGATTENPSFEVIGPLLSRCRVFVLERLSPEDLYDVMKRGVDELSITLDKEAQDFVIDYADGDARRLLNTLEVAAELSGTEKTITLDLMADAAQRKTLLYDKDREEHYNLISAFIKSMRASDPDATVYYLARMYEAGEDPRFIARRMVIFAGEDISLADPQALQVAVAAAQAYDFVGQAEGWIPLSEAAIYLAKAPKSNETYRAYQKAKQEIGQSGTLSVPLHLRNAPTQLMKDLGYAKDYRYPHTDPEGAKKLHYLPDKILGSRFYVPRRNPKKTNGE